MKSNKTIRFSRGYYPELSNLYPSSIIIDGVKYDHVEGFYQASKFIGDNDDIAVMIAMTRSPYECKKLAGWQSMLPRRKSEWDNGMTDIIMKIRCIHKFSCNRKFKDLLISTGSATLIENGPWDSYWGSGPDGTGFNVLGEILMEIRNTLNILELYSSN